MYSRSCGCSLSLGRKRGGAVTDKHSHKGGCQRQSIQENNVSKWTLGAVADLLDEVAVTLLKKIMFQDKLRELKLWLGKA